MKGLWSGVKHLDFEVMHRLSFARSLWVQGLGFRVLDLLGGSWDLVSMVIITLSGVISSYKYSYPIYNPSY